MHTHEHTPSTHTRRTHIMHTHDVSQQHRQKVPDTPTAPYTNGSDEATTPTNYTNNYCSDLGAERLAGGRSDMYAAAPSRPDTSTAASCRPDTCAAAPDETLVLEQRTAIEDTIAAARALVVGKSPHRTAQGLSPQRTATGATATVATGAIGAAGARPLLASSRAGTKL
jgi:hypothetical protein